MTIKKVAVIGAGTMGSGIAGQVANAGIEVWLLDLPGEENPNALAERGLERLRDPNQPGLISKESEKFIHLGNTRDDFEQLAGCDWIAEAVVERLDIKQDLYRRLDAVCKADAIITSNTSTIPIRLLVEDMPQAFRKRFAITHFFNPVRFMRLLELVRGEDTNPAIIDLLADFCEQQLGKGVVRCLDTPGFLGNRVGVFAIQCALHAAFDLGLAPLEADAIFGRPMGIPKTGVFGLYDLIGIDLMSDVVQSLVNILPDSDPFHAEAAKIPLMTKMIANGQTGNKRGHGFYRDTDSGREVLNLESARYQPAARLNLPLAERAERLGVSQLLDDDGPFGRFAWRILSRTLCYAASLLPEVGDDPVGIDDAMKLGYNWIKGPFELIDEIGVDRFIERLEAGGMPVPAFLAEAAASSFYRVDAGELQARRFGGAWQTIRRPEGVIRFSEKRQTLQPRNSCAVASWYDLDGIALVEFHSKANALDADSMRMLDDAIDQVENGRMRGLVVHNDAQHFSCGVNLQAVRNFCRREDLDGLDGFLKDFQQTVQRMQTAQFPVVAAPVGMSIGGGFEVVLHAKQVICHANSVTGLVESLVGVVPGGGGCKETLYRWIELLQCGDDISEACWKTFMNLGYGKTATSPIIALKQAMLRANDRYLINRDRILGAALQAIDDASGQATFERPPLALPGRPVFEEMVKWLEQSRDKGHFMPHDVNVGTEMARIVTGGDVEPGTVCSEQDLYDAERRSFLALVATDATRARIDSMLDAGSPVRN
ncbi:MAG: 3-hydroxyacyl-CoA dehydrogenase NAD-binding domain-containing protein [Gammaproteobacteria bacterium]|nr:3-hydroxyacyl-CoA dehydrogenase NAD-binding domain-containing protein [Gammaproteobacteria bacterium]